MSPAIGTLPALRIARMTVGQVLGVRRFVGLTILALLPAAIMFLTTARANPESRMSTFSGITIGLFFSVVVPVVTLILTTAALGDERRDRTLSFIVLRPVRRSAIAAAKLAGGTGSAALVNGIGAIALAAAMGLRGGGWEHVVPLLVGALIATLAYGGVFTALGYLTERATLVGLAYVFIWESAVAGTVAGLAATSLWRIGFSATMGMASSEFVESVPDFALGSIEPGLGGALVKCLVLAVVGTSVTATLLRRRDLV